MRARSSILRPGGLLGLAVAMLAAPFAATAHPALDRQIADLTARIEAAPDDAMLRVRRGEVHRQHRDWPAAETDFRRALALDPDLDAARLALGRLLVEAGRADEAIAVLTRLLETSPRSPAGRAIRARALAELGRHLEAAEDYTVALEADDERGRPEYYLARARALVAAGPEHRPRALAGLEEGLARLGRPITLELEALELETALGRHEAALARVERLAAGTPRPESWLLRRARLLEAAGRGDEALAGYRDVLRAVDELPPARRSNHAVSELVDEAGRAIDRLAPPAAGGVR